MSDAKVVPKKRLWCPKCRQLLARVPDLEVSDSPRIIYMCTGCKQIFNWRPVEPKTI